MANAVGEGIKAAGGEADVVPVSAVSVDELKAASSFALGCPALGAEVLEMCIRDRALRQAVQEKS